MAHSHRVYDTDAHFEIDAFTRSIKNVSSVKTTVVQFDHNSERFSFDLPRYIDGHDMLLCNQVELHYINIDSATKEQTVGVYEVDDLQKHPDNNEKAVCSWLISENATQHAGTLSFMLRFSCVENGVATYRWNTGICEAIAVVNGMNNGEIVLPEYADIIAQWKAELFEAGGNAVVNVNEATATALSAIEEAGEAKKTAVLASIPDDYTALSALVDNNHRNKAGAIVLEAGGESIVLSDSSEYPLQGLKLFGKSTQGGTPTPDAPIEIVSVENPSLTVYGKNLIRFTDGISLGSITGIETVDSRGCASDFIPFSAHSKLCISNIPADIQGGFYAYDSDKQPVGRSPYGIKESKITITKETFNLAVNGVNRVDDVRFIRIGFAETGSYSGTVKDVINANIQLEVGETATAFEQPEAHQTIPVPHTLPGIPVASGGNYTDANGQQWICDEIDLARGVYVQRVANITLDGSEAWGVSDNEFYCSVSAYSTSDGEAVQCICTHYPAESRFEISRNTSTVGYAGISIRDNYIRLVDNANCNGDIDALKMLLAEQASTENFVELRYVLATPTETPLSDAEIAAFKALHTNKPNTTILNDAGAHMAVSYAADTKLYIDNKIKEIMEGVTE